MRVLARRALEQALPMAQCIEAMADAMRAVSAGETDVPLRSHLPIRGTQGKLVVMPGAAPGLGVFGLKIVSKYPRSPGSAAGTHVGMVILFDTAEGLPLALLEGGTLTEIRTAAASALATRSLATMLQPLLEADVKVCDSAEAAVRGADIVCTTTSSPTPVLQGDWLSPGAHVNLVGPAVPTSAEADSQCLQRARIFVDSRSAAAAEAGELRDALAAGLIGEDAIVGELGELLLGRIPGRLHDAGITLYKSLGMAAQDLAAASAALEGARSHGLGFNLDLAESVS